MKNHLLKLIQLAIEEDVGAGDITTDAIASDELHVDAEIKAKCKLVVAGINVADLVFKTLDPQITFMKECEDGHHVKAGEVVAIIKGRARSLLTGERIALNFLQHLSGVATFTSQFVEAVKHTNVKILDTRKTKPGYRQLDRHAVKMGDGTNHRMGLFDRYLIKNNHIKIAGSVANAMEQVKVDRDPSLLLEVEARDLNDVEEILKNDADIILLDNFSVEDVKQAKLLIGDRVKIEVSGNINLDNLIAYAECGVDFISIGAITHSAPAADIHMIIGSEQSL